MKMAAGAVIVVRRDVTTFDLLDVTMSDVMKSGVKILGAIVIGNEEKKHKYGYGKYGYKNGYKYGYKYGYKNNYSYGYRYGDDKDEE